MYHKELTCISFSLIYKTHAVSISEIKLLINFILQEVVIPFINVIIKRKILQRARIAYP